MKDIVILTDYRGNFGSKYNAVPYNSGFDKKKFKESLSSYGYSVEFCSYWKVRLKWEFIENKIFIHDSIEDTNYEYKSYMEDIIYALELNNAKVLPGYKYIKAHNNKIFMELLRSSMNLELIKNLTFNHFGTLEEFSDNNLPLDYPVVIKGAESAMGRKVRLGVNADSTLKIIKKLARSRSFFHEVWETGRSLKYDGYIKESKFRRKFLLQQFVPKLKNDWKILVFNEKYYILKRGIPDGDFRASGSKFQYGFGSKSTPPEGIFDYARSIYELFEVPYISIDIGFDGKDFFLLEFQFVSFGSSTHLKSDCFFVNIENSWVPIYEIFELEELYSQAIDQKIRRLNL